MFVYYRVLLRVVGTVTRAGNRGANKMAEVYVSWKIYRPVRMNLLYQHECFHDGLFLAMSVNNKWTCWCTQLDTIF